MHTTPSTAAGRLPASLRRHLLVSGVLPLLIAALVLAVTTTVLRMHALEEQTRAHAAIDTIQIAASLPAGLDDRALRKSLQDALDRTEGMHLLELHRPNGALIVVGAQSGRAPIHNHRAATVTPIGELTAVFDGRSLHGQLRMTAWAGAAMVFGLFVLGFLVMWCQTVRVARPLDAIADQLARLGRPNADAVATEPMHSGIAEIDRLGEGIAALYDRESPLAGTLRLNRFLTMVGHHFRQPLQALQLFIAGLQPGAGTRERAVLGQMRTSVATMTRLLDGLVELSRFDAGIVKAQSLAFLASDVFVREYASLGQQAGQRDVDLVWHGGGTLIHSDPVLLAALVHRLASNAIASAPHGRVLVAVRRRGDGVRLEIRDNGVGIDAAQHGRIFDEFVQFHATADGTTGYGLGLAIAQRIAGVLGSRIGVRSEPGRGSTFWIDLRGAAARHRPGNPVHAVFRQAG
jgi:signal transduction histidine kinase